jgi:dienelactone hydrolase
MTAWCDVYEPWPLTTKPRDDTKGLEASVEDIHEIIDKLVSDGIPSERIIVGGFSQGAATATWRRIHAAAIPPCFRHHDLAARTASGCAQ